MTGTEFDTEFKRTIHPPKLIYLFPHEFNLVLISSNIGSHVDNFLGFTPTGIPKYKNGIEPLLQFRKFVAIDIYSGKGVSASIMHEEDLGEFKGFKIGSVGL
jgi:hypothetical protein